MTKAYRTVVPIGLSIVLILMTDVSVVVAQSAQGTGATVQRTEVEDSFFNPCTAEVVDRSYTRHITRRKAGDDYILRVHWSNGRGVGRETGREYTMQWSYHQTGQSSDIPSNSQGIYSYRIKTKVQSQGSAQDYSSDIVVRLRMNADGTVVVDQSEATGVQCT